MQRFYPSSLFARPARLLCYSIGIAIVGAIVMLAITPAQSAYAAACGGSAITGKAFRDYNANGIQDALEPGIVGIVVTAFAVDGTTAACETTTDGVYGIDPAGAFPVRLEFTLPTNGSLNFLRPGAAGSGAATTVTFVNAPTANVNVGFNNPAQYCNSNPNLATSCYVFGEQNDNPAGVNKDRSVLSSFPYTSGSTNLSDANAVVLPPPTSQALAKQIGSVWGLAWNAQNRTLYAGAFLKRHTGFGPQGPGAIYQVKNGVPSLFHNFGALAGTDPHAAPGTTCTSPGHNPDDTNANCWLNDTNAFDLIGEIGFGDLEISDDFSTLYAVNLAQKTLMAIPVGNPGAAVSTAIPTPASCPATDTKPFGLGVNDGTVYVGVVCTAESTQNGNNLRAYIYAFANNAFNGTPILEFPLTYDRQSTNLQWHYWLNTTSFYALPPATRIEGKWAQPWLTDITFDNGNMIIALRDRNGDLFGTVAGGPDVNDSTNYSAFARGDILRACANGSGGWTLESNGTCGGVTTGGASNGQGPGGGEYYFQDEQMNPLHMETSLGAQLQIPGFPDVASIIFNPIENQNPAAVSDAGIKWYNNVVGTTTRAYRVFDGSGAGTPPALFSKANGLGDLVALCDPAPLEIGNRVWNDSDGDGIQDPGENGIDGVDVELYFNGQLIGTTTTANGGLYLFSTIVSGSGTAGGASAYELRIRHVTGPSQPPALLGLHLTVPNNDASANGDARDSDGTVLGLDASYTIPYAALQGPGYNDHTQDFGFTALALPFSVGNLVWLDANNSGSVDPGEAGLPNVTVNLYADADNNGVADGAALASQLTNASGHYLFTGLLANTYLVEVVTPPGLLSSSGGNSEPAPDADSNPTDNDDNGTTSTSVVRSAPLTLAGGEPLGEPPTPGLPDPTLDANANYTLDFGFYAPVSVGNFVWFDTDQNGLQGTTESGVPGVTVRLFNADNTPARDTAGNLVVAQSTTGNGQYLFSNLPPAAYKVTFDLATLPLHHVVTTPNAGPDELDSDAAPSTGETAATPFLPSGSQDLSLDMGIYALATVRVGDYVWLDTNGNGRQESGEPGVAGVTVTLFQADGTPTNLTQVTDSSGFYLFNNLPAGNYYVVFNLGSVPAGFVATVQDAAGDDSLDSDAHPQTGQTAATGPLSPGQQNLTLDLGLVQAASLGDYVWFDQDGDGIQETGEPPVAGVAVTLFTGTGVQVATTQTDANGLYLFATLTPGDYYVVFAPPAGYQISPADQGTDDALDSDVNPTTRRTITTALVSGENDLTWDAGLTQTAALGGCTWDDGLQAVADGILNPGEQILPGVIVILTDASGQEITRTTTDASGLLSVRSARTGQLYRHFRAAHRLHQLHHPQSGREWQ